MLPVDVDDKISKEVNSVDWHKVPEADITRFALAVGHYRDSVNNWARSRAACEAVISNATAVFVVSVVCKLMGVNPVFTLGVVILNVVIHAAILLWRERYYHNFVKGSEEHALAIAKSLGR